MLTQKTEPQRTKQTDGQGPSVGGEGLGSRRNEEERVLSADDGVRGNVSEDGWDPSPADWSGCFHRAGRGGAILAPLGHAPPPTRWLLCRPGRFQEGLGVPTGREVVQRCDHPCGSTDMLWLHVGQAHSLFHLDPPRKQSHLSLCPMPLLSLLSSSRGLGTRRTGTGKGTGGRSGAGKRGRVPVGSAPTTEGGCRVRPGTGRKRVLTLFVSSGDTAAAPGDKDPRPCRGHRKKTGWVHVTAPSAGGGTQETPKPRPVLCHLRPRPHLAAPLKASDRVNKAGAPSG